MWNRFVLILPILFASIVAITTSLILFGWLAHIPNLLDLHQTLAPMQFNTALALCLAAIALFLLQGSKKRLAMLPATLVFGIGACTFFEYLLNVNLGIDEWFVKFYLPLSPLHPGRMASHSSVGLMLVGSAFFILSRPGARKSFQIANFLGAAVVTFSALALLGFFVKLPAEYAWGNFSSMTLQTAIALLFLGSGILLSSGQGVPPSKRKWKDFAPTIITVCVLLVTVTVWQISLWNEARELRQTTVRKGDSIRSQLLQGLEDRIQSIERMASRLVFTTNPSKEAWESDSELYIKHLGVIETFGVVKPDYHVKWIYPEKPNLHLINFDLSTDPVRKQALDNARATGLPQLTPVLNLKQGGRGFILYVPLFHRGQFLGSLTASVRPTVFLSHLVQSPDYEIKIHADHELLYENSPSGNSDRLWSVSTPIDLHGHLWMMEVAPTLETIRASQSRLPYVILLIGVFAALILGLLAQLSITSRQQAKIIEGQKKFVDGVIHASPIPILVLGLDHKVQMWNLACERVFGWTSEEVIGHPLRLVPEESRAASARLIEQIFLSHERLELEATRITKDGRSVPVRIVAHALRDELDQSYGLVAVLDDLTERKKAEQEIRAAHLFAEKAAQIKAEFLANMSHEIRTPLNGIIGMADLLLITQLNEDQKRYAKIIQNSGSSLLTLINDILDFSKIEAGKMQLEALDFSLATLVESQADLVVSKARKKGLVLNTFISPDLPAIVRGDSSRLGQIILNLLGNAIKFTEKGSVSVTATEIKKDAIETGPVRVRFEVKDTGIGLSEASSEKLFLPFSQVDGSMARKYGGTGLGLSISKNIAEAMGGAIGIESVEGQGSTFWFEVELNRMEKKKVSFLERRVLVLDDDLVSSENILRYLSAWRMHGRRTDQISEAVAWVQEANRAGIAYDVVLVGKQCEAFVKAFGIAPPRIILLTEFEDPVTLEAGSGIQISGRITKPVKQSELYDHLIKLALQSNPEIANEKSPIPIAHAKKWNSGIRVLVADDVAANQLLTVKFLEYLGYQAQAVGNGKEALEQLERSHFDLVLMDCQMPEMDGYEATDHIRKLADPRLRSIPIIALTANAMGGDDQKCLAAGMDDYLSKPFKKERLNEVISKWITKKAS